MSLYPTTKHPMLSYLILIAMLCLSAQKGYAIDAKITQYSKSPFADKIDVNLLALQSKATQQKTSLSAIASTNTAIQTQGANILLDIVMNRIDATTIKRIKQLGVHILFTSKAYHRISASIHNAALLNQLASLPEVRSIRPEYGAISHVGSVTSRADKALKSDVAKAAFGLDGTGQKIGILSDSFACSGNRDANTLPAAGVAGTLTGSPSQDSADLPASVEILSDLSSSCTDEGAAMGELVHDIAPKAAIAFASAFAGGQAGFATGINNLCSAPVNSSVVVDDVSYFAEPMYQDGIIAQAAAACVTSGVPYYSSAGNIANRGFKQTFLDINPVDDQTIPVSGNDLHKWRATTGTIRDGFIAVTLQPNEKFTAVLQWNQPFDSVKAGNGSQIDMDLYIAATPDVAGIQAPLASSTAIQGTTGAPAGDAVEITSYTNTTGVARTVYVAADHFKGSQTNIPQNAATPVELRLVFFGQGAIEDITNGTSSFGGPTIYGHSMAVGASSVAAVPWYDTANFDPTYTPSATTDPESFSSRGGTLAVQFNANGAYAPRSSFEPDISSVDGNNTRFFGSPSINLGGTFGEPDAFKNFFGTSAAAPNAAAIAALIRQRNPTRTPAQINTALETTAIDITGTRAALGDDDVSGIGLIDANAAITSIPASADVSVSNIDSPDPSNVAGHLTYTITITNHGPTATATSVSLTDTLDANTSFVSAVPNQGSCSQTGTTVTCSLGNVTQTTPATVVITVIPTATGTINNTASITAAEPDPSAANNSAAQSTVINAAATTVTIPATGGGGGGCLIARPTNIQLTPVLLMFISLVLLILWQGRRN